MAVVLRRVASFVDGVTTTHTALIYSEEKYCWTNSYQVPGKEGCPHCNRGWNPANPKGSLPVQDLCREPCQDIFQGNQYYYYSFQYHIKLKHPFQYSSSILYELDIAAGGQLILPQRFFVAAYLNLARIVFVLEWQSSQCFDGDYDWNSIDTKDENLCEILLMIDGSGTTYQHPYLTHIGMDRKVCFLYIITNCKKLATLF